VIEKFEVWSNEEILTIDIKSWIDPQTKNAAINATFNQTADFEKEIVRGLKIISFLNKKDQFFCSFI
jgi:hypothetical protein